MSDHESPGEPAWAFHACGLDEIGPGDDWLSPWEERRLGRLRFPKRRLETRLGRWTAKMTVGRMLGLPVEAWAADESSRLASISIENLPGGAPMAFVDDQPAAVSISMTDRADWAVCMASTLQAGSTPDIRVGCDLELVEPRSERFVEDWFTPVERRFVAASGDVALNANLIWSAKESALKVLRTGLRRDTRTVEVAFDDHTSEGWSAFAVTVLDDPRLGPFPGWWRRFGDFVLTCAADTSVPPPLPLHGASPLHTATPSHAWLHTPPRHV